MFSIGEDRGPVLEVIVSRTNFISSHTSKPVRVVGLSTALANARDLADWLGIGQVSCTADSTGQFPGGITHYKAHTLLFHIGSFIRVKYAFVV